MSSVVISGDTSGAITLAAPAVAGTNTINLPAATGTVMVSGNMPAFLAYKASTTSGITSATITKVTITTEAYDTNSNYDAANSRFTPTVAGFYLITAGIDIYGTALTAGGIHIYKNGSNYHQNQNATTSTDYQCNISGIVYCNGSTDYVEIYAYAIGTGLNFYGNNTPVWTWFDGAMVRTA